MPPNPSLPQGAVFYMVHKDVKSSQPHYLVVLNANAATDKLIVLGIITSQVDKSKKRAALRGCSPESLVEFSPQDYWPLSKPSLIDCNACVLVRAHGFRQEAMSGERCANVPAGLLTRILEGVRVSKTNDEIKRLLGLLP